MSSEQLRLFLAVNAPESVLIELASRVDPLRRRIDGARWAPIENQHVTLKFLGATPAERVGSLLEPVRAVAANHAPFELRLAEIGSWPERGPARVLWTGFEDPSPLRSLAGDLDAALVSLGYPPEKRAFRGHLTLARFKKPVPVSHLFEEVDLAGIDPFTVGEVGLWRSRLSPKGARYQRLETAPLLVQP